MKVSAQSHAVEGCSVEEEPGSSGGLNLELEFLPDQCAFVSEIRPTFLLHCLFLPQEHRKDFYY